ncbi:MAG: CDP-glycerol glycerophosphotransferase family protein [Clostridia bacterium]|nr:CDP-glycerol glycerophosphotransferase family protein [Clostridia bacterium]
MKKYLLNKNEIISLLKYYYYRIYVFIKRIKNDDLWIISERGDDARDNSYHLFKYIRNEHPEINIKYIIKKESADYYKIKDLGNIIDYGSKEHYIAFLTAKNLISTHVMGFSPCMSLFLKLNIANLIKVRGNKINIKHGITKDYIRILDYKYSHLDMLVAAANSEYEYFIDGLKYPKDVVKKTGFARFDNLVSIKNKEKSILIMPTFRKHYYNINDFKETEFYKIYNGLLNDKKIISILEENKIKLYFYPHYEFQKYINLFYTSSDSIVICSKEQYDVQDLLLKSSVLITDYSSVFFDYAYMLKPMIFYQFDYEEYRKNHYHEGYFDYQRDGFGKIVKNQEELIKELIGIINNNYEMDDVYKNKTNKFFCYIDNNNCERIFKEIKNISKEKNC